MDNIYYAKHSTFINVYGLKNTNAYIEYALSFKETFQTGLFTVCTHPDLIFINLLPWDENCQKACEIIVKAAKKYNIIIEFNANEVHRRKEMYEDGLRSPYPHLAFWENAAKYQVPSIINSYYREPKPLYDEAMNKTSQLANQWHVNIIETLDL